MATANTVTFSGSSTLPANTVVEYGLQLLKRSSRKPAKNGYRVKALAPFAGTGTTYAITVPPGAYAARYCFVDKATGQRTAFVEIPVSGVALSLEDGGADAAPAAKKRAA